MSLMRHPLLLAVPLALPLLTGCKTTMKERLSGQWVGAEVHDFPPAQVPSALGWAKGASFTFQGSQVTVAIPAESPRTGTFQITQSGEQHVVIAFRRPEGTVDEVAFQLEGDEEHPQLRWLLGDGRSVLMRKGDG